MARFDLSKLPGKQGYVVEVPSDHASSHIRTQVAVPLLPLDRIGRPLTDLNPIVRLDDRDCVFVAQSVATLTQREMSDYTGSLKGKYGDAFAYALDILLTGF